MSPFQHQWFDFCWLSIKCVSTKDKYVKVGSAQMWPLADSSLVAKVTVLKDHCNFSPIDAGDILQFATKAGFLKARFSFKDGSFGHKCGHCAAQLLPLHRLLTVPTQLHRLLNCAKGYSTHQPSTQSTNCCLE